MEAVLSPVEESTTTVEAPSDVGWSVVEKAVPATSEVDSPTMVVVSVTLAEPVTCGLVPESVEGLFVVGDWPGGCVDADGSCAVADSCVALSVVISDCVGLSGMMREVSVTGDAEERSGDVTP